MDDNSQVLTQDAPARDFFLSRDRKYVREIKKEAMAIKGLTYIWFNFQKTRENKIDGLSKTGWEISSLEELLKPFDSGITANSRKDILKRKENQMQAY